MSHNINLNVEIAFLDTSLHVKADKIPNPGNVTLCMLTSFVLTHSLTFIRLEEFVRTLPERSI